MAHVSDFLKYIYLNIYLLKRITPNAVCVSCGEEKLNNKQKMNSEEGLEF